MSKIFEPLGREHQEQSRNLPWTLEPRVNVVHADLITFLGSVHDELMRLSYNYDASLLFHSGRYTFLRIRVLYLLSSTYNCSCPGLWKLTSDPSSVLVMRGPEPMEFTVLKEFSSAHEKHAVLGLLVRSSCGHGHFLALSIYDPPQLKKLLTWYESGNVEEWKMRSNSVLHLQASSVKGNHYSQLLPGHVYASTNMLYK